MSRRIQKGYPPPADQGTVQSPISTRRIWFFRLLMVLLPIVLFGVLEISLRLGGYGYDPHFFRRIKIGNEEFFVQNEDFSRRFFPKELLRNAGPLRFPVHKAPGTFRIFVLGESAAMGDPALSFAPDRYLEVLLREKYPDRRFEIINVAFTAINSHVILPIAQECAEHEGDLWIIYMGNNEMVGPFGAVTVFGMQAPPLSLVRLGLAIQRLRSGQWLMELARKFRRPGETSRAWGGMAMFLDKKIGPNDPRREVVYRNFQKNLHDILRTGLGSGAKILLNTVAVNLKDCPPFASTNDTKLSTADRAQFDQFYSLGMQAAGQKEITKAAELFERASQIDPGTAELQFHWGECLLAQTNVARARERFQLACDYDALPFRADSHINAAIRAEGKKAAELTLFEAPAALAASAGTAVCGRETFYEHVHFDLDGRYSLGRAWAEQIETMLPHSTHAWASQQECEQMLGLSPWNRAQVIHFMIERILTPPLSLQANNGQRRETLEGRMARLRERMKVENPADTRTEFFKLLKLRPTDFFLHQEFALFLELTGDVSGAAAEWERFRDLLPQDSLGYYQSGRLFVTLQRHAEAEAALQKAVAIRPSRVDGWIELGNALAMQKKYAEALASYSTALNMDAANAQTLLRRGKVLGYLNRHAEAMASYRAAIQLNPADGLSHYELAAELLAAKDLDAAGKEFGEAARLTPDRVAARFNYGTWLMSEKHWQEAQREFEAVLRLEPDNVPAKQRLAALLARTK